MTKTDFILTLLLILIIVVATIHMVSRAISIDDIKQQEEIKNKL